MIENEEETMWWEYENLPSGEPYDWSPAVRGGEAWDNIDFHLDLGCGRLKKGRLGIDRHPDPTVDLVMDLETGVINHSATGRERIDGLPLATFDRHDYAGLPFPDNSIESIISHHCMEHLGEGFLPLMDECYRVMKPGAIFRIIVPLYPSRTAVEDPDHRRYFMEGTFETFMGRPDQPHWHEEFSTPYTNARFEIAHKDVTPRLENPAEWWGPDDAREIRVALRK